MYYLLALSVPLIKHLIGGRKSGCRSSGELGDIQPVHHHIFLLQRKGKIAALKRGLQMKARSPSTVLTAHVPTYHNIFRAQLFSVMEPNSGGLVSFKGFKKGIAWLGVRYQHYIHTMLPSAC